ncbi:MAG TPA: efflux RND transporter periplasmic adaptor subunit, partial [Terriglobia bacterium]|nr:efflux RND transporter periplasmic adaptor subunit [Terriglobia bacterium]
MKDYRKAFQITLALSIVLAAGLAVFGWRYFTQGRRAAALKETPSPAAAASKASTAEGNSAPAAEPAKLTALQLSPQRLQSIGVTSGEVEVRELSNQIRAVGNVAVDERLEAYVQTRFSGWIQKVYANSTYQYVKKGQPLFTIYSPELVTTENEYLLAMKNQDLLQSSTVPGVASGAGSLLTAARERLKQWNIPAREIQQLESTGQV